MPEWSIGAVSKTVDPLRGPGVRPRGGSGGWRDAAWWPARVAAAGLGGGWPRRSEEQHEIQPAIPPSPPSRTVVSGRRRSRPVTVHAAVASRLTPWIFTIGSGSGEVPEWSIGAVSKTVDPLRGPGVRPRGGSGGWRDAAWWPARVAAAGLGGGWPRRSEEQHEIQPAIPPSPPVRTVVSGRRRSRPVTVHAAVASRLTPWIFTIGSGSGEVPEWSIGAVSKTVDPLRGPGVRIPPSPPFSRTSVKHHRRPPEASASATPRLFTRRTYCGEVSEWPKEHAWKACVGVTPPRVRIPPSPPSVSCCRGVGGRRLGFAVGRGSMVLPPSRPLRHPMQAVRIVAARPQRWTAVDRARSGEGGIEAGGCCPPPFAASAPRRLM